MRKMKVMGMALLTTLTVGCYALLRLAKLLVGREPAVCLALRTGRLNPVSARTATE